MLKLVGHLVLETWTVKKNLPVMGPTKMEAQRGVNIQIPRDSGWDLDVDLG
jgi:hypothetical protein